MAELVEKYKHEGMPLTPDSPEREYDFKKEIGRGKFAVIKKCLHEETKKEFAAKLIKFDDDEINEAVQEFDVHRTLSHPNIASLYSGFIVQKYIVLMIELLDGKDAVDYLASKSKVTEEDVADIIKKVLEALEYLHSQDVMHLDVRPANIIVNEKNVQLIDFGCARRLQDKNGEVGAVVGNTEFTAPEMLSFEPVNISADMWSLGVTTYLLLAAELPFLGDNDDAVAEAVKKGTFFFDEDLFPSTTNNAKDFINSLICKIPRKRMDAATAKAHAWLSPSGHERRKASAADPERFKEINDELNSQEEDELVVASCVLRTFEEEPYESSEEDDDDDDDDGDGDDE